MVEPRLTPAQKIGTKPFFAAASTERPRTRAGSVRPSTWRGANSGPAFFVPLAHPVASATAATITTEQPTPLRTRLVLRQRRLRGLFEPASRHLAPVAASPQQVDKAQAPEIGSQLAVAQVLGDRIGDETSHVRAALVPPIRVLLEQQRGDRDDHGEEDRDGKKQDEERR